MKKLFISLVLIFISLPVFCQGTVLLNQIQTNHTDDFILQAKKWFLQGAIRRAERNTNRELHYAIDPAQVYRSGLADLEEENPVLRYKNLTAADVLLVSEISTLKTITNPDETTIVLIKTKEQLHSVYAIQIDDLEKLLGGQGLSITPEVDISDSRLPLSPKVNGNYDFYILKKPSLLLGFGIILAPPIITETQDENTIKSLEQGGTVDGNLHLALSHKISDGISFLANASFYFSSIYEIVLDEDNADIQTDISALFEDTPWKLSFDSYAGMQFGSLFLGGKYRQILISEDSGNQGLVKFVSCLNIAPSLFVSLNIIPPWLSITKWYGYFTVSRVFKI